VWRELIESSRSDVVLQTAATDEAVRLAERDLGLVLPAELRSFLSETDGLPMQLAVPSSPGRSTASSSRTSGTGTQVGPSRKKDLGNTASASRTTEPATTSSSI
jgi:hypothetical protein